jgi:protein SCO1/2
VAELFSTTSGQRGPFDILPNRTGLLGYIIVFLVVPFIVSACARRYRVEGLVLDVNQQQRTMIVSHRAISGYMDAMAMPFRVPQAGELRGLNPGDLVEFQLIVKGHSSHAEKVRLGKGGDVGTSESLLVLPEPKEQLKRGETVPDFELTDQSHQHVRLSDFRGKVVVMNFIYTRCPLPEVCPRLSASFAELQRRFRKQVGRELILLSVTLDSQHDTSEVLAEYGARWGADAKGWHFLTGESSEIERIAGRFGLIYWPEEGLLTHTSQTAIVGRNGRLAALIEGFSYEHQQLGDLVAQQMEVAHVSHRRDVGSVGQ